ncbi:MAG: serine/threonine protein kinase, partial [Deltaproteobacteria bacterium]|nr:serine/threonine protein kinase [Deltaproteobacteria bacterium]
MSTDRGVPFGDYALVRRLARGGMAEVFLARQKALDGWGRQVAIKRILPHLADAPALIRMFVDEARVAATLSHSNIVHIYDVGKVGDDYYIAMEFVDGIHAGQLVLHRDRLPPTLIARIGADAAAALAYAHDHKDERGRPQPVVHRDVSPHNLMVSWGGAVKLVDFGIAKALGGDETRPGVVKGKYAYMSPEQAVGRTVGGASDVFSLGLVLWELCAGRHAFERGDPAAVMRLIRDGRVPSLAQAAPGIPMPLAEAIGWALQREPGQRATAAELGAALEGFIKASPELATPRELAAWLAPRFPHAASASVGDETGKTIGTVVATGTSAALGTAVGVTAIGTAIGTAAVPARARTSTAPPPRPRTATAPAPRAATAPR